MASTPASPAHFDLVIIGSGSGNSVVRHEMRGWRIAIIESGIFGGTCTNVGCIPTKMYVYAADVAETARDSARYGIDARVDGVRWTDIRDRIFGRIDPLSAGGRDYRANGENTFLYESEARFSGPRELTLATGQVITGDRIVIAAGSRATVPDIVRDSGVPFHTSDTVMRIDELPRRMAILGGGYIAAEFAHVFSALGVQVSVIARSAPLLRHLDEEVASAFTEIVKNRWDVHLSTDVNSLAAGDDGIRLDLSDGSVVEADLLLVATGRIPNTDRLDAPAAGLRVTDDGRVWVDDQQRTSVDGVWALGDISSPHLLKHVANHEARVVSHNLVHPDQPVRTDHRYVPAAVFTHPQIASVGLTEAEARAAGHDVVVKRQEYGATAYGWAMEDTENFCKLVADRSTGKLLGAHLMGPFASTLIQPLIQAMSFEQTVPGLARGQYWIHPALSEVVENALLGLGLD